MDVIVDCDKVGGFYIVIKCGYVVMGKVIDGWMWFVEVKVFVVYFGIECC